MKGAANLFAFGCALHYIMCFPLTLMEGLQWELAA